MIDNKEKGNLALKEIIDSEMENNQRDIYNLNILNYENYIKNIDIIIAIAYQLVNIKTKNNIK